MVDRNLAGWKPSADDEFRLKSVGRQKLAFRTGRAFGVVVDQR
jgi:hypothetical protein